MNSVRLLLLGSLLLAGCGAGTNTGDNEDATSGNDASESSDGASGNDAASGDDSAAPDDVAMASACTSGTHWTSGNHGSQFMNPGMACITCHSTMRGAPNFTIAGTVFPSLHEEDLCDGARNITVEVTDSAGQVVTMTTNTAGNFYSTTAVQFPIHARVLSGGRENHMTAAQSTGDCNSCHTQAGANEAPGRITAP